MNHYFKMPYWYHFKCFFQKAKNLTSTSQIKGFDMLRWDDQNKIKEKLGLTASTITTTDDEENEDKTTTSITIDQFQVEYAKSNRSKCRKCDKKIEKVIIFI
jgi:hypothetical protein